MATWMEGIPTNHPAFCLNIKQKGNYPSIKKITKSALIFVTAWDRSGPYILERLAAFSGKNDPYQASFIQISSKSLLQVCRYGRVPSGYL